MRDGSFLLALLYFLSGGAALAYQVVWVRQLSLLLGSGSEAAAVTMAIFLFGLAAGGWFWGRRASGSRSALRTFAFLEIAVAPTALAVFAVSGLWFAAYPSLHGLVEGSPSLSSAAKALVAATVLGPSTFLMGGTLPLLGEHLVRRASRFAATGSAFYAINTAGGAAGAIAAGFFLPRWLGYVGTSLVAASIDVGIGLAALALSRGATVADPGMDVPATPSKAAPAPGSARSASGPMRDGAEAADAARTGVAWPVLALAACSGVATLAVEVLWGRMFALVLHNSVYTYALVLSVFLVSLALGAAVSAALSRRASLEPMRTMAFLLAASGLSLAATPWIFVRATGGLDYVGQGLDFGPYVAAALVTASMVMLVPGTILGTVLPWLLRVSQASMRSPGDTLGRILAANTLGAVAGALGAGFTMIPAFGTWRSLLLVSAFYLAIAALPLLGRGGPARRGLVATTAIAAAMLVASLPVSALPGIRLDDTDGEVLVERIEGRSVHAAVVDRGGDLRIRVNNWYTIGGSGAARMERDQAFVPLLAHPRPRSVFFLGMGTGITAGAALDLPVERVVVCELLEEVVTLSRRHFARWTNGLFEDPRAEVRVEDGRHCLSRSPERYDAIVSDLFTPWEAGVSALYSLEHFRLAASRLEPGGIFVQWVPLYQVSMRELEVIGATMRAAFPQVTAWRGDFLPSRSVLAFVGSNEAAPLDPAVVIGNARRLSDDASRPDAHFAAVALRHYAGNLSAGPLFADAPVHRDDLPILEFLAPRTQRRVAGGSASFVVGEERDRLYDRLLESAPVARDPFLVRLDDFQRDQVEAGRLYSHAVRLREERRRDEAMAMHRAFTALTPDSAKDPDGGGRLAALP